jgi:hypothetical protein
MSIANQARTLIALFLLLVSCDKPSEQPRAARETSDLVSEVLIDEQEPVEDEFFDATPEMLAEEAAVEEKMKNLNGEMVVLDGAEMEALRRGRARKR